MDKAIIKALLGIIDKGTWEMAAVDAEKFVAIVNAAKRYLVEDNNNDSEITDSVRE